MAEIAIEEATEKTPEPPVKAAPATTAPNEDQLREAAEIEILVDRAAEEEAAKIEELVRPFASQATPAMDAEKERELNVGAIKSITLDNGSEFKSDVFLFFAPDFVFVDDGSKTAADLRQAEDSTSDAPAAAPASAPATQAAPAAQPAAPAANADGLSNEDALLLDFLIGKTLNDDVANADDTFALPKGTEITREIALDAKKHDALLLLTMSVD